MRLALAVVAVALAACAPALGPGGRGAPDRVAPALPGPLPDIAGYGAAVGAQPIPWTSGALVEDFIELTFDAEWGLRTRRLRKWEGPVRISLIGDELSAYADHARGVAARLDAATGPHLAVYLSPRDPTAEIVFRSAPLREMRRVAPGANCFFVPFSGDWTAFREARRAGGATWANAKALEAVTVFIPSFAAPHDIRTCLEEEAAQALGPRNDLFRLSDSIFNDDAAHLRLTSFDALMLRTLYDPDLKAGMTRDAARKAARRVLAKENAGFGERPRLATAGDREHDELRARSTAARGLKERAEAAARLLRAMKAAPAPDHRLAEAHAMNAYIAYEAERPQDAIAGFQAAERHLIAIAAPDDVRLAIIRGSLAAVLKREGKARAALAKLDLAIPVLAANAHDGHLAQALRWRAACLHQLGERDAARRAARDALAWATYVYGRNSFEVATSRREFALMGL